MQPLIRLGIHALHALLALLPVALNAAPVQTGTGPSGALSAPKAILSEQTVDLRKLIASELAAGRKKVVVPPGRYRVAAEAGGHLSFSNLQDVEIVAYNVEMVCTATVQALGFYQCTNVQLRGLTVDYDPLPFTQGRIVALGTDKSSVEFELFAGYPEDGLVERIEIFNPTTRELRRASYYGWGAFERTGPRRYRISKGANYRYRPELDTEQVGDFLVTNHQSQIRGGGHAVVLTSCTKVTLADVKLYASPAFGFIEHGCSASTYLRCTVARRDSADDPVKRGEPRLRSTNADAFHSKSAFKGPAIIDCVAHFQGDDCVNINGRYYYVLGTHRNALRIAATEKLEIATGDQVEFLPYSGPRPANAVAVDIKPITAGFSQSETALIKTLPMVERVRARLLGRSTQFYELTLNREVNLPEGSAVCSALRVGDGFVVHGCDFGDNRSRGILIKASSGEISGNHIANSRMAAVLISPEFNWLEAGCSSNVTVRDNVIIGIGQTPIRILAPGGNGRALPAGAHRNIAVLDNHIVDCPWPLVEVTSTSGLTITGNVWAAEPPLGTEESNRHDRDSPISIVNCDSVKSNP